MRSLFTGRIDMDCKEGSSYYILWLSHKKLRRASAGLFSALFCQNFTLVKLLRIV